MDTYTVELIGEDGHGGPELEDGEDRMSNEMQGLVRCAAQRSMRGGCLPRADHLAEEMDSTPGLGKGWHVIQWVGKTYLHWHAQRMDSGTFARFAIRSAPPLNKYLVYRVSQFSDDEVVDLTANETSGASASGSARHSKRSVLALLHGANAVTKRVKRERESALEEVEDEQTKVLQMQLLCDRQWSVIDDLRALCAEANVDGARVQAAVDRHMHTRS